MAAGADLAAREMVEAIADQEVIDPLDVTTSVKIVGPGAISRQAKKNNFRIEIESHVEKQAQARSQTAVGLAETGRNAAILEVAAVVIAMAVRAAGAEVFRVIVLRAVKKQLLQKAQEMVANNAANGVQAAAETTIETTIEAITATGIRVTKTVVGALRALESLSILILA